MEGFRNFTPADDVGGVGQCAQNVLGQLFRHQVKGGSEHIIAHQNRNFISPFEVQGFLFAADFRIVDDIVMDEGGDVDHFQGGAQGNGFFRDFTAVFGRQDGQGGTDSFSAGIRQIIDHLLDEEVFGPESFRDRLLDAV